MGGGGRSLLRTRLQRNSLITPDLQGKNTKQQGSRRRGAYIGTIFQRVKEKFPAQRNSELNRRISEFSVEIREFTPRSRKRVSANQ